MFTVPPGGDGMYYFSTFNVVDAEEHAVLNLEVNGATLCQTQHDSNHSPEDRGTGACAVTQNLNQGRKTKTLRLMLVLLKEQISID